MILDHFLPFYPLKNLKNQNFEKNEKNPRDLIILQMCTLNSNHMMYYSGDNDCSEQTFDILGHFLPIHSPRNLKNENFQKMKNISEDIIILHKCTKDHVICYTVPEIRCMTDVILIFYFGLIFAILPC